MSRASLTVALFLTSIAGGLLGTSWWDQTPGTTYLWVPSGLALAAFLILGYRVWPVVAVAALAVALITVGPSLAAPFVAGLLAQRLSPTWGYALAAFGAALALVCALALPKGVASRGIPR